MTIQEILQSQGMNAETVKSVLDAMRENKIFLSSEENMDIRYNKLKADHDGVNQQLNEANAVIEELKKSTKGQENLQSKIAEYENRLAEMQKELLQTKINSAIKVELLGARAKDVDYLTFKLNEKLKTDGAALELDDNGTIKGFSERLDGLKTQFPTMFDGGNDGGLQVFDPNALKGNDNGETVTTKDAFRRMSYEERVALKQRNESLYKQLSR